MSTSGVFLGSAGTPYALEHEGRVYRFARLDRGRMDAFSTWLIDRTRTRLAQAHGGDPAKLAEQLALLAEAVLDGEFDFMEPLAQAAARRPAGMLALVSILAGCEELEAAALLVARRAEAVHLLDLVLAESLPGYRRARAAGQGEGGEAAGGPEGNVRQPPAPGPSGWRPGARATPS